MCWIITSEVWIGWFFKQEKHTCYVTSEEIVFEVRILSRRTSLFVETQGEILKTLAKYVCLFKLERWTKIIQQKIYNLVSKILSLN